MKKKKNGPNFSFIFSLARGGGVKHHLLWVWSPLPAEKSKSWSLLCESAVLPVERSEREWSYCCSLADLPLSKWWRWGERCRFGFTSCISSSSRCGREEKPDRERSGRRGKYLNYTRPVPWWLSLPPANADEPFHQQINDGAAAHYRIHPLQWNDAF